jgi:HK97 family phage major capsid protein
MDFLTKLRVKAQNALSRQTAIIKAADDAARAMTDAEAAEYATLDADIEKTLADIDREAKRNEREVRVSATAPATAPGLPGGEPVVNRDVAGTVAAATQRQPALQTAHTQKLTMQQQVGLFAWCTAKQHHDKRSDPYEHMDEAGFKTIGDTGRQLRADLVREKALISISGGGANTIFTPLSSEFIEFLRNQSAFMVGQPIQLEMPSGSMDISGGNTPSGGTYGVEGVNIGYNELTTRKVNLTAKHLRSITSVGNYLIEVSPLNVAAIAGEDLAQSLTVALDNAGLRGDGTGANPAGIRFLTNAAHIVPVAAGIAPTQAVVFGVIRMMLGLIRASNVPVRRRRWIMSSRVFTYLQFLIDANGNKVFPGLADANPTLENYPVTMSEQVPSTLGAGTNESELYLVDFGHVLMGIARALSLKASTEASYINSGGTLVSSFSLDETVIRGVASHDFDMRHTKAAVVATAVQWGA